MPDTYDVSTGLMVNFWYLCACPPCSTCHVTYSKHCPGCCVRRLPIAFRRVETYRKEPGTWGMSPSSVDWASFSE
eukprot:2693795-Pleurochrysis_carterae.AAC.1